MVTQRKYVAIDEVLKILETVPPERVKNELANLPKRQSAPPCPEGGISQSEAARKYKIGQSTISRWVTKGYIPVILKTSKHVYIDESALKKLAHIYLQNPGQGCRIIEQKFKAA